MRATSPAVLAVCVALSAGCTHPAEAPSDSPAAGTSSSGSRPQEPNVFFPGNIDTYGLNLSQTDRDHLTELHALRQLDPCAAVDAKTLESNGHKDFSYTFAGTHSLGEGSPLAPIYADICAVAFPDAAMGIALSVLPGETRANDNQFTADPSVEGVTKRTSPLCSYRATLPLTGLSGAPKTMRDPLIEVTPINISSYEWDFNDTSLCQTAEAVAGQVAARAREKSFPVFTDRSAAAAKFVTADPCAAATDLHAIGFVWKEPSPEAQWPSTWRHPSVCNLQLTGAADDPNSTRAIVRSGFAIWSDRILFDSRVGDSIPADQVRSEQDGVELFDLSSPDSCLVIGKGSAAVEPTKVGAGAAELVAPTPVVSVRMSGANCAETTRQAVVAAIKRGGV